MAEALLDSVLGAEEGHAAAGAVSRALVRVLVRGDQVHAVLDREARVLVGQLRRLPLKWEGVRRFCGV